MTENNLKEEFIFASGSRGIESIMPERAWCGGSDRELTDYISVYMQEAVREQVTGQDYKPLNPTLDILHPARPVS